MNITELIKKHLKGVIKEQESHISEDGTYMVLSNLVKIKNDIYCVNLRLRWLLMAINLFLKYDDDEV